MPLNVLPSITKPPRRVARAEVQVRQPAVAPAVAPFGREHDQVERVRALDLEPAGAAAARFVRRVERLRHHAFVAARERVGEEVLGGGDIGGDEPRDRRAAPAARRRAQRSARAPAGRPAACRRGRGSRRRTPRAAARRAGARRRACGRSAASSPGTAAARRPGRARSPRRRGSARRAGSARSASTISGTDAVTSFRRACRRGSSSPALWTCTRAPSSFYSKAAVPSRASASSMSSAGCASIGCTGRCSAIEKRASPAALRSARRARPCRGRRRPSPHDARRPPARRPRRRSRRASRPRARPGAARRRAAAQEVLLGRGARANSARSCALRAAAEPLPVVAWMRASAASTSPTVSVGLRAMRAAHRRERGIADADPALPRFARQVRHDDLDLVGRSARASTLRSRHAWRAGCRSARRASDASTTAASNVVMRAF